MRALWYVDGQIQATIMSAGGKPILRRGAGAEWAEYAHVITYGETIVMLYLPQGEHVEQRHLDDVRRYLTKMQERVFFCPGWPPPPYGAACGHPVHVRPDQVIEIVNGTPETLRPTAEQLAELGERDVLCRSCAAALLEERARCAPPAPLTRR